jgi:CRISPR/Cas system-associated protein Cas7 (RAMP superfamily)
MKNDNLEQCISCNKLSLTKDEIGVCKKILGRKVKQFYCMGCLANMLEVTTEELLERIEEFKIQGCTLFA